MAGKVALYSAVDEHLTHYDVDIETGTLRRRSTIELPAKLQYAWPHPTRKFLYTTTTNGGPRVPSDRNHITALAIGPDGDLRLHGTSRPLPLRAVHLCLDPSGRHALNAHNYGKGSLTIHRIEPDGTVGAQVEQPAMEFGIYPHQVMVFPSGRSALIVDRGNKAQASKPEDPGALRSFAFADGLLSSGQVIAPGGGYGFGPRHVAFHQTNPWMYVSDERTNRLVMFRYGAGDRLDATPTCTLSTLAEPENTRPRQIAGPIHVHPSGRFVYVANRADHTIEHGARHVFGGGENNIAVYAIDAETGEPSLVQHAQTHSFHVRTFAIDPTGRLLVAASIKALDVLQGGRVVTVPAALSVFRIGPRGTLAFIRKVDVETTSGQLQYWAGMVGLG